MARRRSALMTRVAISVCMLTTLACSGGGSGAEKRPTTTPPAAPTTAPSPRARVRQLADRIGCSKTVPAGMGLGFSLSEDCRLDGRLSVRIHTFDASNRGSVKERFSQRSESNEGLDPCPDGRPPGYQWVVLGPDWAVITVEEHVARELEADLDAEMLDDGGRTGPPVSYSAIDPCA